MRRRDARVDNNQREIVKALRACGASVLSLAALGKGVPDLLVSVNKQRSLMVEVKDGSKPPSARKLTADQVRFHATWAGEIVVVSSIEEAIETVGIQRFRV
jgi:Holliday junction resolvase